MREQSTDNQTFLDFLKEIKDPRIDRKKLHPVAEILLLTLVAVICGAGAGCCYSKCFILVRSKRGNRNH